MNVLSYYHRFVKTIIYIFSLTLVWLSYHLNILVAKSKNTSCIILLLVINYTKKDTVSVKCKCKALIVIIFTQFLRTGNRTKQFRSPRPQSIQPY